MAQNDKLVTVATLSLQHEGGGVTTSVVEFADWVHVVSPAAVDVIITMVMHQLEGERVRFETLAQGLR